MESTAATGGGQASKKMENVTASLNESLKPDGNRLPLKSKLKERSDTISRNRGRLIGDRLVRIIVPTEMMLVNKFFFYLSGHLTQEFK